MRKYLCLMPLAMLATQSMAGEILNVQVPAALAADAPMLDAVKMQCAVPQIVGEDIFASVGKVYANSKRVGGEASTRDRLALKTTILSAQGWAGGYWSGSKEITIRIDLVKNGKTLDTTTLDHSSSGGLMGPFKGTCDIFRRDAEKLANQVAKWVAKRRGILDGVDARPEHLEDALVSPAPEPTIGTKPTAAGPLSPPAAAAEPVPSPAAAAISPQAAAASAATEPLAQSVATQMGCGAVQANGATAFIAPCGTYSVLIDCDGGQCRPMHTVNVRHDE